MKESKKLENVMDHVKHLKNFFVGSSTTYGELQKVLLIFKLFNLDTDLGQSILDAIEADWLNREPEEEFAGAYLDGMIEGLEAFETIQDSLDQRRREAKAKLAAAG